MKYEIVLFDSCKNCMHISVTRSAKLEGIVGCKGSGPSDEMKIVFSDNPSQNVSISIYKIN